MLLKLLALVFHVVGGFQGHPFDQRFFVRHSKSSIHESHLRRPHGVLARSLFRTRIVADSTIFSPVDVQFGDTGGAALVVKDTTISRGPEDILEEVNWRVMPNERWAIVGPNGAGKSTLLSSLVGRAAVRQGSVCVKKGLRVGYLEQTAVAGSNVTVREEVASRMDRLQAASRALEAAQEALSAVASGGDESSQSSSAEASPEASEALNAFVAAQERFEAAGGLTAEKRIGEVLSGLGFAMEEQSRPCSEFSGGWQMRIALARLLLSEPDLLLLDEPTNHLDAKARDWVANFVAEYKHTVVLVSHDEELLRTACDSVAEVSRRVVEVYKGMAYDKYLWERTERAKRAIALYSAQVEESSRLQDFIDRFGASATKATQAKDRQKKLARLRAEMGPPPPGWVPKGSSKKKLVSSSTASSPTGGAGADQGSSSDDPSGLEPLGAIGSSGANQNQNVLHRQPVLKLPPAPPCGEVPLRLDKASVRWKGESDADNDGGGELLRDVNLVIERDMRLVIRGPNGAGKSTLVHALAGRPGVALTAGKRVEEQDGRLRLGFFTQDLAQDLDQSAVALDVVMNAAREYDPLMPDEEGRRVMGALGLTGQMALRKIGELSGGEKARVALSLFCLVPHNVIVLDEPSNHLDVSAVAALQQALVRFEGALVVISHDRMFASSLFNTHVAYVNDGKVTLEKRPLCPSDWRVDETAQLGSESNTATSGGPSRQEDQDGASGGVEEEEDLQARAQRRQTAFKKKGTLKKLEEKIANGEAKVLALDDAMFEAGSDTGKVMDLLAEKEPLEAQIAAWYDEWAEIEELLGEFPDL